MGLNLFVEIKKTSWILLQLYYCM